MASSSEVKVKEVIVDSRIKKVLALRTDSIAIVESLDAISQFYVSNTVEARRSLRQDIELLSINISKKFLEEYDKIKAKINKIELNCVQLEETCSNLSTKVTEANVNMETFMSKTNKLSNIKTSYVNSSKYISNFLSNFILSADEINILYNVNLNSMSSAKQFFNSLNRLYKANKDCKYMVENHLYAAGFELLDILNNHQDIAYQKLFEWVKLQCDNLSNSAVINQNSDETDVILQVSIRYLRKLPVYYAQCQDLIVNSRRSQLFQRFILALTQGSSSSLNGSGQIYRALDLHSNDPLRYVSDMLSWIHQTTASEKEFLISIFEMKISSSEESSFPFVEDNDFHIQGLDISELLARCLQGLGRPLRARIMQTLESRLSLDILYLIMDLFTFYYDVFNKIIVIENAITSTIKGCRAECKRIFQLLLSKQNENLLQNPASCPLDLTMSHHTKECMKQIHEILKISSTSLNASYDNSTNSSDKSDTISISDVLGQIIQPLLQSCRLSCQHLSQSDMAIFMLNNVTSIQGELNIIDSSTITSNWVELLHVESTIWINILVNEESNRILRRSDMDKLLDLISVLPPNSIASETAGLSNERVHTIIRAFYATLFSNVTSQFDKLVDPLLREKTRKLTSNLVANSYDKIHDMINEDKNNYDKSVISHSKDEVRVILGCF